MSVPFVTGNVTATEWFILLYYRNLLYVNSGLLYLSCMFIGFGLLVKDGAKTISDCLERFISERRPNPAASSVVRSIYQDSSEKGRVETAMKRFAIEESR